MKEITRNQLYLLVKLLRQKKKTLTDQKQIHNLNMKIKAYNILLTRDFDEIINNLKQEEKENGTNNN
jgi:hypothetical protein